MKYLTLSSLLLAAAFAPASPKTFSIAATSKQLATVESNTAVENFTGKTSSVTGSLKFDPARHTGGGKIAVDVSTIKTGIDLRDQHLQSPNWLDSAKYPKITFVTTKVSYLGNDQYAVTGKFSLHGVTRTVTTTASVKYLAAGAKASAAGFAGDVVQIKTSFQVAIADYKITIPDIAKGKVADTVKIAITTYGTTK